MQQLAMYPLIKLQHVYISMIVCILLYMAIAVLSTCTCKLTIYSYIVIMLTVHN